MRKKTVVILLILFSALVLAEVAFLAFNRPAPETTEPPTEAMTEAPTVVPTEAPTQAPTEEPTEPPTEAPTEPPMLYANPLTGEPMAEAPTCRIFGITINNVPRALPHVGANQADLFFEMFVNDYATRGLAFYYDIRQTETIGSVRSMRYNFTDLAIAYDAFIGHAGGSNEVISNANKRDIDHFNIDTSNNTSYSFRDKARNSAGWGWEHCLFVKGPGLYEYAEGKGYRVTQDETKTYGLNFAEDGTPADGETANKIDIIFNLYGHKKQSTMTYDPELGCYVFTQYGKGIDSVKDANRETFENVFVVKANVTNKGVYHVADLDGSGEGYFACGGKIIPIKWYHENETDPITFTLEDGTPLVQGIGNSYIAITPLASDIEYE